jgi:DNA-binding NarL/FixJ family response regulator
MQSIRKLRSNVFLLDPDLRNQNNLQVVKFVKKRIPGTGIILMDLIPLESDVLDFVKAGVSGFILKDATTNDFQETIRSVALGDKVLPIYLADSLFPQIVESAINNPKLSKLIKSIRVTKRERQVIELVANSMATKKIAQELHLSTYTV